MIGLRPRPAPRGAPSHLVELVDPLTWRIRQVELQWVAQFVPPGSQPGDAASGLGAALGQAEADRASSRDATHILRQSTRDREGKALRAVLAAHIRSTVPHLLHRWADLRALRRDLDGEALAERLAGQAEVAGTRIEVAIRVAQGLISAHPAAATDPRGGLIDGITRVATADPRPATRRAALRVLVHALVAMRTAGVPVPQPPVVALSRISLDDTDDPWARRAAVGVAEAMHPDDRPAFLDRVLATSDGREPFLVRAQAVTTLLSAPDPWRLHAARRHRRDASELVRARLVDGFTALVGAGARTVEPDIAWFVTHDSEPRIRARACVALGQVGSPGSLLSLVPACADTALVASFAVETALAVAGSGASLPDELVDAIRGLAGAAEPGLAAMAARVLQRLERPTVSVTPPLQTLADLEPGRTIGASLGPATSPEHLARALVPYAEDGYGYELFFAGEPDRVGTRVKVRRGDTRRARPWRFLHEVRNPDPAKRQRVSHTVGRGSAARIRVPPRLLAERARTAVPGERRYAEARGGWVPELPLVTDYLDAARGRTIHIVTSVGKTTIVPPPSRVARAQARMRLTVGFDDADQTRERAIGTLETPALFTSRMKDLGFDTRFEPRVPGSPSTTLFAGTGGVLPYLLGTEGNTLVHLGLLVAFLMAVTFGRIAWLTWRIRRARRQIPLVMGGWGSRGKSGTERLKAGLLEGLGVPVLGKTTGCEAMVLHAPPGGRARELFLFRPFDKVSIWEQTRVVRLAAALGDRAMLWECMALNPDYRDMLQQRWMRDDLSTLTNAYPDHEDIMGPSGVDVAEVIGGFAPPDGALITTEVDMLPVLARHAGLRNARFKAIPRAVYSLLPADLLTRFPTQEHPANVALVAAVGAELGVGETEAIGLMAEHVVPDLGALMVTAPAPYEGRECVFVNGMSANDRLSFLHNWRSTGFASLDHHAEPDHFLVTVVNNRADRVPRSQVFARVLANDAAAHRHVVIGTNVRGFLAYLLAAVELKLAGVDLNDLEALARLFAHLKIADAGAVGDALAGRLGADEVARTAWRDAVAALPMPEPSIAAAHRAAEGIRPAATALARAADHPALADALVDHTERWLAARAALRTGGTAAATVYRALVRASVILVEDSTASGDRVVHRVLTAGPPGARVRVMGVQNIKGTGLDFAYQWIRWRELGAILDRLEVDPHQLEELERFPWTSVMLIDGALPRLADKPAAEGLVKRLHKLRDKLLAQRAATAGSGGQRWYLNLIERIIDPFDGVRRQARALKVFDDLVAMRISHTRAQVVLQDLTKRQKGGWLKGKP